MIACEALELVSEYDFFSYAAVGFVGVGKWILDSIKNPFTHPYACSSA